MTKTTIKGWSLDTHSDFVKRLDKSRKRFFPARRTTLKHELELALGYKRDLHKQSHRTMKQWMGKEDTWYKYRESDFRRAR